MKKQTRAQVGDVFAVPLEDGEFGFGQVHKDRIKLIFFDLKRPTLPEASVVVEAPVLFVASVRSRPLSTMRWPIIGRCPVSNALEFPPLFVSVGKGPNGEWLLTPDGSTKILATSEEVKGRELLAVWDGEHIEERLNDHFAGRQCKWLIGERILGLL